MPLEQIRPLLSLDSRSPSTRKSALADDDEPQSPYSPRSPSDGDALPHTSIGRTSSFSSPTSRAYHSSIVGPASPTVRSSKSLFSDQHASSSSSSYYNSYSQWPHHLPSLSSSDSAFATSPERPHSSASFTSNVMDLQKLGAVGGVNRSGSWKSSGVSSIGRRGLSETQNPSEDPEASSADTTVMAQSPPRSLPRSSPSSPKHPGIRQFGAGTEEEREPLGSSSRASTVGSHHSSSYSAAAFSLRSLSNRSSTGSTFSQTSQTTAASASPPSGSSARGEASLHDDARAASKVSGMEEAEEVSHRDQRDEEEPRGHSGFVVGPGVSRVRSIGRGMTGAEQSEGQSQEPDPRQQAMASGALPGPEADDSKAAAAPSQEQLVEDDHMAEQLAGLVEPSDSAFRSSELRSPVQSSFDGQGGESPRRQVKPSTSFSRLAVAAARGASPRYSPQPAHLSATPASIDDSDLSPRKVRINARPNSLVASPPWVLPSSSSREPLSAQSDDARNANMPSYKDNVAPVAPRRHTGGLRTRSVLGQQIGMSRSGTTSGSSAAFGGPGQEGGRRAARERARHPSLANFDNAPFSVLEAMRRGIRIPANLSSSDRATVMSSSPASSPAPADDDRDTGMGTEAASRPLSPIAHASPDVNARWSSSVEDDGARSASIARSRLESSGSASFASISDADGGNTQQSRGGNAAPLSPSTDRQMPSSGSQSPAAPAIEQEQAQQLSSPRSSAPSRRQSRPNLTVNSLPPWIVEDQDESEVPGSPTRTQALGSESLSRSASSDVPLVASSSSPRNSLGVARPSMARALSAATNMGSASNWAGAGGPTASGATSPHPSSAVSHVLRTPTTEEWARYLASQGLEPARSAAPRTRTSTGRSGTGPLSERQRGVDRLAMSAVSVEDLGGAASPRLGPTLPSEGRTLSSRNSFYGLRPTLSRPGSVRMAAGETHSSGRAADSFSSLVDALSENGDGEEDDDDWRGSVRSRSSSGSSDSSQGRMEALHAAISMPPSRRGTPPPSMPSSGSPNLFASSPSRPSHPFAQTLHGEPQDPFATGSIGGGAAVSWPHDQSGTSLVQDPMLGQRVREMHGYVSAPGRQRSIDDFHVESDVGRGAYGLVKLVRLKDAHGQPSGPEFVVKYIIKSRILADCWRRHRVLGPIPVEIHVMDQLRRLAYHPPAQMPPWSPEYLWHQPGSRRGSKVRWQLTPRGALQQLTSEASGEVPRTPAQERDSFMSNPATPVPPRRPSLTVPFTPTERNRATFNEVKEINATRAQTHPALCTMLDFFEDESFYYLVMPRFGQGTDLFDYIESHPYGLSTREARCVLGQVASGLAFLHANNIVHRDIKDENVVLNGSGHAQLIDFGSSAHVRNGRLFDTFSGTLDYAAAEILRGDKYGGKEQDVWALGVVAYVCLVGDAPFWNGEEAMCGLEEGSRAMVALEERCSSTPAASEGPGEQGARPARRDSSEGNADDDDNNNEAGASGGRGAPAPARTAEDLAREAEQRQEDLLGQTDGGGKMLDARDLIEHCLSLDPADRPTAEQVLRHVFLAGEASQGEGDGDKAAIGDVATSWRGWRGWEKHQHLHLHQHQQVTQEAEPEQ